MMSLHSFFQIFEGGNYSMHLNQDILSSVVCILFFRVNTKGFPFMFN